MSYFESRLPINIENFKKIQSCLNFCEKLGIKNVIIEPTNHVKEVPLEIKNAIEKQTKINIFYRLNLKITDISTFKKEIINYNNFSDVISVESLNREVLLHAAKDSRVGIISFSDPEIIKKLSIGIISLSKQNKSFIEFSLAPIMVSDKKIQSKNLRNLYKYTQLAIKLKAKFIISGNFYNKFDYRHPRALISICNALLGIPLEIAKKAFGLNPRLLLEQIQKQKGNLIDSDINIISGGIDHS
ncbi:MAG: RNase P subunit p30 family protein [Promethearchaeota archaeon]